MAKEYWMMSNTSNSERNFKVVFYFDDFMVRYVYYARDTEPPSYGHNKHFYLGKIIKRWKLNSGLFELF